MLRSPVLLYPCRRLQNGDELGIIKVARAAFPVNGRPHIAPAEHLDEIGGVHVIAHVLPRLQRGLHVEVVLYRPAPGVTEHLSETLHAFAAEAVAYDVDAAVLAQRVPDHQIGAAYIRVYPGRQVLKHASDDVVQGAYVLGDGVRETDHVRSAAGAELGVQPQPGVGLATRLGGVVHCLYRVVIAQGVEARHMLFDGRIQAKHRQRELGLAADLVRRVGAEQQRSAHTRAHEAPAAHGVELQHLTELDPALRKVYEQLRLPVGAQLVHAVGRGEVQKRRLVPGADHTALNEEALPAPDRRDKAAALYLRDGVQPALAVSDDAAVFLRDVQLLTAPVRRKGQKRAAHVQPGPAIREQHVPRGIRQLRFHQRPALRAI